MATDNNIYSLETPEIIIARFCVVMTHTPSVTMTIGGNDYLIG